MSARTKVTRWLAYTVAVLAPLGDTIRRWGTWQELAMQRWEIDPALIATEAVFTIKLVGTLLAAVALALTLADTPNAPAG